MEEKGLRDGQMDGGVESYFSGVGLSSKNLVPDLMYVISLIDCG